MTPAIEAAGLVKSYPKGVKALDGLSFQVLPGAVFALLGPTGRAVDRGEDPDDTDDPRRGTGQRGRIRRGGPPRAGAPRRGRRRPGIGSGHPGHRTGEPAPAGPALRDAGAGAGPAGRRAARPVRAGCGRRPDRPRLLGRHAAPARHRDGARPRSGRFCSSTSRPPGSIPRSGPACGRRSPGWPASRRRPSC